MVYTPFRIGRKRQQFEEFLHWQSTSLNRQWRGCSHHQENLQPIGALLLARWHCRAKLVDLVGFDRQFYGFGVRNPCQAYDQLHPKPKMVGKLRFRFGLGLTK